MNAPVNGWTTELLFNTYDHYKLVTDKNDVLEAFISNQWIGSTEV